MTDKSSTRKVDNPEAAPMKYDVPKVCIACHAEKLGIPVTAEDCLGFAACETCTKDLENVNGPLRKS